MKRPALLRCLKALDDGDTLIVLKLDCLGRSLHDVVVMLDDLYRRGGKFHSLTESFDTKTPMGRAIMQMAGVLAELERNLITERTREGSVANLRVVGKINEWHDLYRLRNCSRDDTLTGRSWCCAFVGI